MKTVFKLFFLLSSVSLVTPAGAQTNSSFVYDGVNRSFIVYTPPSFLPGSSLPLVFVLHGFTQTAQNIMDVSGFNAVADTGDFIVVYPNGVGNAWNTNSGMTGGSTADDIGFIAALTDTMFSRYGIDTTRIYSCGFSAGGYMSHRLACESSRCYAAIASVAGTMSTAAYADCQPIHPIPVLQIHGTSDAVVSYTGGIGGVGVDDVITKWTTLDVCPTSPVVTQLPNINLLDLSTVESNLYTPCSANTEVKLLKVIGGGHQWPGTTSLLGGLGNINRDINASGEIWNFFRGRTCNTVATTVGAIHSFSMWLRPLSSDLFLVETVADLPVAYRVHDLKGRTLFRGEVSNGEIIDLSAVSHGCYLLVLQSATDAKVFRLVK